jgi:methylated-DNA-protein-cysteine methyltransferase-like protein
MRKTTFSDLWQPLAKAAGKSATGAANPAVEAIWHVVAAIPRGQISTYGAVARAAGLPGRARQTGYALRIAPKEMHLPWHRVLGAGGRIVFPKTSREYKEQAKRLKAEGVAVQQGRADTRAMADLENF